MKETEHPPGAKKPRYVLIDEDTINRLIDAKMTAAQYRAFFYFSLVDPFGNRPVDTSGTMARERLDISKSTYYGAIAALQEEEFFDFEDVVMRVRNKVGSKSREKFSDDEIVREIEPLSEESNPSPENRTPVQEIEPPSEESNSRSPEPKPDEELRSPQYLSVVSVSPQDSSRKERDTDNKTFQEENKTEREAPQIGNEVKVGTNDFSQKCNPLEWTEFSAPGADPDFFQFVVSRVAHFPQPAADALCVAESWIRKQGHLLYSQYRRWVDERRRVDAARQAIPPDAAATSPPPDNPDLDLTPAARLAKYRSLWQIAGLRQQISKTLDAHPEWGLEIGPDGPQEVMADADGPTALSG